MKKRKVSGLGVVDLMTQAMGHLKVANYIANKMKSFNMVQCWTEVKDCPKWHVLYACYDGNPKPGQSNAVDVDGATPSEASASNRPRGQSKLQGGGQG
jgi:hypothetical protein